MSENDLPPWPCFPWKDGGFFGYTDHGLPPISLSKTDDAPKPLPEFKPPSPPYSVTTTIHRVHCTEYQLEWLEVIKLWLPGYVPPGQPDWSIIRRILMIDFGFKPDQIISLSVDDVITLLRSKIPPWASSLKESRTDSPEESGALGTLGPPKQINGNNSETRAENLPTLPPDDAWYAWFLCKLTGLTQGEAAIRLQEQFHRPYDQSKISRRLKQVQSYLDVGGQMPEHIQSTMRTMDPRSIDMGKRVDRRSPRPSDTGDPVS